MGKLDYQLSTGFTIASGQSKSNVLTRADLANLNYLLIFGPTTLSQTILLQVAYEEKSSYVDADFRTFQTPSGTNFAIAANAAVLLKKPPAAAFRLTTDTGTEAGERTFPLRGEVYGPWMR